MLGIITVSAVTLGFSIIFHAIITIIKPSKESKTVRKARKVLFVSAHPDDECMFFGPSIRSFLLGGCDVYILCLSTGDYEGIGNIRKKEFYKSCEIIGVQKSNITVVQHSNLYDNPGVLWQKEIVGNIVLKYINQLSIDTVITFDDKGVSGHLNHISCHEGMIFIVENELLPTDCTIFKLLSVNKLRKYCGILDIVISYLTSEHIFISNYDSIIKCQKAMHAHWSQMVWFRHLYILFSSYMIVNNLQHLKLKSSDNYPIYYKYQ